MTPRTFRTFWLMVALTLLLAYCAAVNADNFPMEMLPDTVEHTPDGERILWDGDKFDWTACAQAGRGGPAHRIRNCWLWEANAPDRDPRTIANEMVYCWD